MLCDFCSSPTIKWAYPASTFDVGDNPLEGTSVNAWAACDECHALIEADNRRALYQRSFDTFYVKYKKDFPSLTRKSAKEALDKIHRGFFEHRTGPAQPVNNPTWS